MTMYVHVRLALFSAGNEADQETRDDLSWMGDRSALFRAKNLQVCIKRRLILLTMLEAIMHDP